MNKKILFITGTRADYGKLKTLISACDGECDLEVTVFATGMHMLSRYGNTIEEIRKQYGKNVYPFINQGIAEHMEIILSNTISGLSRYLDENHTDLIVVHGDRVEALAGAIVGGMKNVLVAHVEGGECSGTIDESMRHAASKFSHIHLVNNQIASDRILRLGENPLNVHVIGSPNVDIIVNGDLPNLENVKAHYEIPYNEYSVLIYHPVTTEIELISHNAKQLMEACVASGENYVVIMPNNDMGSDSILKVLSDYHNNKNFRMLPSMRFEAYLTLLKHSSFIVGNSSSGIYDAPLFGVPTINIGTRQKGRFSTESIVNISEDYDVILGELKSAKVKSRFEINEFYGEGNSSDCFLEIIREKDFFNTAKQKYFFD